MEKQIQNYELGNLRRSNISLPETDFPSFENPIQFFKVKQRLTQNYDSFRIGAQVTRFLKFQQDYIYHFTQYLACECQFLKIFLIQPNYLYLEMSMMTENQSPGSRGLQALESNIFEVLEFAQRTLRQFFRQFLSEERVMDSNFSYDKLMEAFNKNVIQKVNNKYKGIFKKNN